MVTLGKTTRRALDFFRGRPIAIFARNCGAEISLSRIITAKPLCLVHRPLSLFAAEDRKCSPALAFAAGCPGPP